MEQLALPSLGSEPSSTTPTSETSRFDESGLFSAEVRCFLGEFVVVVEMRLRLRLRTGEGVIFNLVSSTSSSER